jgi:hypothetical protein
VANELPWVAEWLFSRLRSGLVEDRVHEGIAPPKELSPYIVWQLQFEGNDLYAVGAERIWTDPLVLVKAIDQVRDWAPLSPIADEIDARLHKASGVTVDGQILSCARERPWSFIEYPGNIEHRHLGGFYRILVRPRGA